MATLHLSKHKKKAQEIGAGLIFEDEVSFRQDPTLHQTWSRTGNQPLINVLGQRKAVKIFGCIEIYSTGFFYHRDDVFNAKTYLVYLELLAKKYFPRKIILIQDNASYHKDSEVWAWFKSNRKWLEVHQLPPYSPDFNAAEPLWRYTRLNGTHNRYFITVDELIGTLNNVFRSIQKNPEQIKGYIASFL